ncbi:hypothetical protein PMKS-002835 [Pichia membranifaciens]|uniref:Uncharacterized protein n=1 Tax=Pichia membranifaciens TaxID=4926 RepID=A0A1Q2YJ03_9ASCO|nr:hypothetical protein PMKS-002835 [Pichia membranifaciens]
MCYQRKKYCRSALEAVKPSVEYGYHVWFGAFILVEIHVCLFFKKRPPVEQEIWDDQDFQTAQHKDFFKQFFLPGDILGVGVKDSRVTCVRTSRDQRGDRERVQTQVEEGEGFGIGAEEIQMVHDGVAKVRIFGDFVFVNVVGKHVIAVQVHQGELLQSAEVDVLVQVLHQLEVGCGGVIEDASFVLDFQVFHVGQV